MHTKKRLINIGAGFEQKLVKPTIRKNPILAETANPSPNAFDLPVLSGCKKVSISTKQSVPAFSFGSSHSSRRDNDGSLTPGPASYFVSKDQANTKLKKKECRVRIPLRTGIASTKLTHFQTPGPGDYNIASESTIGKVRRAPNVPKNKSDFQQVTPAPNAYKIAPTLGINMGRHIKASPAYTISERLNPPQIEMHDRPGPGDYTDQHDIAFQRSPQYSLGKRVEVRNDNLPGPADYLRENVVVDQKSIPAPSIGIQHTPYKGVYIPLLECSDINDE